MMMMMLLCAVLLGVAEARAKIQVGPVTLPGSPSSPAFAQYSGYVEVNATAGANMFFWLFESQSNPAADPVVLWLTGGP